MSKPLAVVTGSSRGIGRAVALRLKDEGYTVVGLYKSSTKAAADLSEQGIDMQKADVGQDIDTTVAIDHIIEKYKRLDVVINNAGIDIMGKIETYDFKDWNTMIDTDLTSVFLMSKKSIPHLKKSENPVIVNVSSRLGIAEYSEPDFIVYGAVKAAVNVFTVGLAKEVKNEGIRVNAVIPTPTKTDLFDEVFTGDEELALKAKGKLGTPDEVADLVVGLIKDKHANGQILFDKRVNL